MCVDCCETMLGSASDLLDDDDAAGYFFTCEIFTPTLCSVVAFGTVLWDTESPPPLVGNCGHKGALGCNKDVAVSRFPRCRT